jgi:hypothetical protein
VEGVKEVEIHRCTIWRGRLSQDVFLLHNNACPHSVTHTKETLQELKFEALDYLSYSPDISSSDFHLFGPLKEALRGCQFADEVNEVVHDWLCTQPKSFFYGIRNLWTAGLSVLRSRETVEK